jgi:exosome complex component RRP4
MSKLLVNDKSIVVPGEVLAEGMDYLPGKGTYRLGDRILAEILGLVYIEGRAIKLIPLSGRYMPKRNDTIIAKVIDVTLNGWRLEINSAYTAMLPVKDATAQYIARGADLTTYFNIGDYLVTKITNVTSQKLVDVTTKGPGLKKLYGGRIIKVNPHKVPRIIGKQGSMVSLVKDATGTRITVGQNGLIWIDGEPANVTKAVSAIHMIEDNSHTKGLTDKVKAFLGAENLGTHSSQSNYQESANQEFTDENGGSNNGNEDAGNGSEQETYNNSGNDE